MKLLARLLSHGFAVALVVLLAIGFIYRGELFPEWELPDFIAFDSAESTADDEPAGKIEPAPIQEEPLASGPATGDQQASGVEDAAAGAMPPVEEVAESGAPVVTESAPPEFSAPVVTESAPVDASEAVEASEAEMPAAPAVEADTPAGEAPVTTIEAVEEPLVLEMQESVEEAAPPVPEATADVLTETVSEDAGTAPSPAAVTAADGAAGSASVVIVEAMEAPAPVPEAVTAPDVAESAAPMPSGVEPVVASEEVAQDPASQVEAETTIEAVEEPLVLEMQESVEEAAPPVPEATADVLAETVSEDAGTAPSPAAVTAADGAAESASVVIVEEMEAPAPEAVTAPDVAESAAAPMPSGVEPAVASEEAAQDPASQVEADEAISYYQLLASAREAYWLRDYQTAEDFYRRMIADDPDNPDGYGELANMYFNQGNWEAAASAYYEAGSRLVKAGLLAPARELVDVIRGLNGPQADALDQEVQAAHESLQ